MSRVRDPLFSVHTTDSGKICLYLEERDACVDLVEDVVGQVDLSCLDELQAANRTSYKVMLNNLIRLGMRCLKWLCALP
jgi:hypothetical protein